MEYRKNGEHFSFGFGSLTTAGTGSIAGAKMVKTKKKGLLRGALKTGAKVSVLTALIMIKFRKK